MSVVPFLLKVRSPRCLLFAVKSVYYKFIVKRRNHYLLRFSENVIVPHQRLLLKLKAHGIGDGITDWVEQWLTDRRQRVVVDVVLAWSLDILGRKCEMRH